jgi:uncharacterized repeat protein (TIGR02543 family)
MKKLKRFLPVPAAFLAALLAAAVFMGLAGCEQLPGVTSGAQESDENNDGNDDSDDTPNTTPGSFTVSFDSRGGSPVASQTVAKSGAVTRPSPDPARDGYTFAGWFTGEAADADDWSFTGDTVTSDITLYARWKPVPPDKVLVNFDSRGGTYVESQSVAKGATIAAPNPAPARNGYTLDGWYKDEAGTEPWDFDNDTVAGAITLYALWTPLPANSVAVTFDSRGGSYVRGKTVVKGGAVSRPSPDPFKADYVFDGWYKDAEGTAAWDFSADTASASITLYAAWRSVWLITSAADLAKIGVDPLYPRDGSYTLTADITLNDWKPLCADNVHAFSGTFDGGGHTITLKSFNAAKVSADDYIGIFGYVKGTSYDAKARIGNVNVVSSVDAVSSMDTGQTVGLLAGYANRTEMEDITLSGSLTYTVTGKAVVNVGGVAGWIEYRSSVKNSGSSMTVDVTGGYDVPLDPNIVVYSAVGAFVGLFKHESEISGCHNTGNLTGRGTGPTPSGEGDLDSPTTDDPHHAQVYVGGIAGSAFFSFTPGNSGIIKDCSSTGDITATATGWWAFAAGIAGSLNGGSIENCTAGGRLSAVCYNYDFAYAGGITAYGGGPITGCHFGGKIIDNPSYYVKAPIEANNKSAITNCTWNEDWLEKEN